MGACLDVNFPCRFAEHGFEGALSVLSLIGWGHAKFDRSVVAYIVGGVVRRWTAVGGLLDCGPRWTAVGWCLLK